MKNLPIILLFSALIISCNYTEDTTLVNPQDLSETKTLSFNSYQELQEYVELLENDGKDQTSLEISNKQEFKTFESKAKDVYQKVLKKVKNKEIKGIENILKVVKKYHKYIGVYIDDNEDYNFEPKLTGDTYAKILNEEGEVYVGDQVLVFRGENLLEIPKSDYSKMNEKDILDYGEIYSEFSKRRKLIETIPTKYSTQQQTCTSGMEKDVKFDGDDSRLEVKSGTRILYGRQKLYFRFKNQERFGCRDCWWNVSRTTEWGAFASVTKNGSITAEVEENGKINKAIFERDYDLFAATSSDAITVNGKFTWADSPAVDYVLVECNWETLCDDLDCEYPYRYLCLDIFCSPGYTCVLGTCEEIQIGGDNECSPPCGLGYRCRNGICQAD